MNLIQTLEKDQMAKLTAGKEIPDFGPGDTVLVNVKVVEGDKSRVQAYAWCELAQINGNGDATLCRDAALESMSNTDREIAFRLVVELRERQRSRR